MIARELFSGMIIVIAGIMDISIYGNPEIF